MITITIKKEDYHIIKDQVGFHVKHDFVVYDRQLKYGLIIDAISNQDCRTVKQITKYINQFVKTSDRYIQIAIQSLRAKGKIRSVRDVTQPNERLYFLKGEFQ